MTLCRFQAWSPYTIKSWIGSSHQGLFACHIGFRFQLLLDNHAMQSLLVVARFTTLSLLLCFRVIYVFACWQKIFDWSRATTVLWLPLHLMIHIYQKSSWTKNEMSAARKSSSEIYTKFAMGLRRNCSRLYSRPNNLCSLPKVSIWVSRSGCMTVAFCVQQFNLMALKFQSRYQCETITFFIVKLIVVCGVSQFTVPSTPPWLSLLPHPRATEELSIAGDTLPRWCGESSTI